MSADLQFIFLKTRILTLKNLNGRTGKTRKPKNSIEKNTANRKGGKFIF